MRRLKAPQDQKILTNEHNMDSLSNIHQYSISIVTPMFGGSAIARKVDTQNPVHAGAIRGHLRFWWRATIGAKFENAYELKLRERELFGDASLPSRVKIWVENVKDCSKQEYKPPTKKTYQQIDNCPYPRYLFQKDTKNDVIEYISELNFELFLFISPTTNNKEKSADDIEKELKVALWAWINFGGLGARTRRGAGSLYCQCFSPDASINNAEKFNNWFFDQLTDFQIQFKDLNTQREWPTLSNDILITNSLNLIIKNSPPRPFSKEKNIVRQNIKGAWADVIHCYEQFRHKKSKSKDYKVKQNEKGKREEKGRSLWPEPDSIRKITGMREPDHSKNHPETKGSIIAFPRAQFGLPIIFKFRQDRVLDNSYSDEREPYTTLLLPKNKDRLSSPLILKAIAIAPGNNESKSFQGFGAIIRLNHPLLQQLELKYAGNTPESLKSEPEHKDHVEKIIQKLQNEKIENEKIYPRLHYEKHPMRKVENYQTGSSTSTTSALEAFFHSEEVRSFCKIQIPTS